MTVDAKQKTSERQNDGTARRQVRAVFLDAAGTLVHVREPVGAGYARVAAGLGITLDPDSAGAAFRAAWQERRPPVYPNGQPSEAIDRAWWKSLVLEVLERCGVPDAISTPRRLECFEALFAHYARPDAWRLYPEVIGVLDGLARAGIRQLVVSNFDRRLHGILEGLGIRDRFDGIVLSSESGAAKPSPWIFRRALDAAGPGLEPGDCLHAGDDPVADWMGAERAGLQVFRVERPRVGLGPLLARVGATPGP